MPCIEFLTKRGAKGFQCPVCDEFHEQPKKGYPKNTDLARLCEKKANKVSRSGIADVFASQLDDMKSNMDKLAQENDLGEDKIKEYCDELRNEVQLHLEESTESLKKQSLELIKRIGKYEREAMLKFNTNLKLDTFLSETRRFHEKWTDYLKQFKIDDEQLKLASNNFKKLQNKLNNESELLTSKRFNFNLLKFTKGTSVSVFGSLVSEGGKQSYMHALASMKPHKLRNLLIIHKKKNLI
jgi:hypothetical protein